MKFIKSVTNIDFLGPRRLAMGISLVVILGSIVSLSVRGLNFGIDFTGGTLVEVGYEESVDIGEVRQLLVENGLGDAQVQYFGSSSELLVRLPVTGEGADSADLSSTVMEALREPFDEVVVTGAREAGIQQCVTPGGERRECGVQMRRVEFVGPAVGEQLTEQGGLAMIYALIMILIYIAWRFEWRFALGSVAALVHDVIITIGIFSMFQMEFSLPVLAAVLAVIFAQRHHRGVRPDPGELPQDTQGIHPRGHEPLAQPDAVTDLDDRRNHLAGPVRARVPGR